MNKKSRIKSKQIKNKKFKLFLIGGGTTFALTSLISIGVDLENKKNDQKSSSAQKYLSESVTLPAAALQYDVPTGNTFSGSASFSAVFSQITDNVPISHDLQVTPFLSLILNDVLTISKTAFSENNSLTWLSAPIVKSIGDSAFEKARLTSLSLPEVTTLGDSVFHDSLLTSLSLPKVTTIGDNAFTSSLLTSLSFPEVTTIGDDAFPSSPLASISLPKATTIGDNTFTSVVNASTTKVNLQVRFNTVVEKNRIFGAGNWDKIDFDWTGNAYTGNVNDTIKGLIYSITNVVSADNATNIKDAPFESLTLLDVETIADNAFLLNSLLTSLTLSKVKSIGDSAFEKARLTSLSLPEVTTLGDSVFHDSLLTSLSLPKVTTIGDNAFTSSLLTSLSFPEVTTIGDNAFLSSPLTSISLPKATTIGDNAFTSVVNASTTKVKLPVKFNTVVEKNRIFGAGNWDKIDFDLYIADGNLIDEDYEQEVINNLVSIGATVTSTDVDQATRTTFDDAAMVKYGIKNIDNTVHSLISKFTYEFTATTTSIKIYVSQNGVASTIASVEIPISRNSFSGTFFPLSKEREFLAITTTIGDPVDNRGVFHNQVGLTQISLPNVINIGSRAFFTVQLTSLEIPFALTIGDYAFQNVWKKSTTNVTMQYKFNTVAEKNRIFGRDWDKINFTWVDDKGNKIDVAVIDAINAEQDTINDLISMGATATQTDAAQATKASLDDMAIAKYGIKNPDGTPFVPKPGYTYEYTATSTGVKLYVSKSGLQANVVPTEISLSKNFVGGTFTTPLKRDEFLNVKTSVAPSQFMGETGLTSLSLPEATAIGDSAFHDSPLTSIDVPKVTTIGDNAFASVVNASTTKVNLPIQFNTDAEKNRIFGVGNWDKITFIGFDEVGHSKNSKNLLESPSGLTQLQKILIGVGSGAAVVLTIGIFLLVKYMKSKKKISKNSV